MEEIKGKRLFEEPSEEENNISTVLYRYLANWQWFVIGIVLAIISAFIYLRLQVPLYEINATILVKDDKKGGAISELSAFEDLGLLKGTNNMDNEIEVLKSRSLMNLVVKELKLNIGYFIKERPIDREKFGDSPVQIHFLRGDSSIYEAKTEFLVSILSNSKFKLSDEKGVEKGTYEFGKDLVTKWGPIIIYPVGNLEKNGLIGKEIKITVTPFKKVVEDLREEIKIDPVNKTSNVILIALKSPVKSKGEAIVNNLIKQHNADAIADKNLVSKNTAEFINDRINYITSELSDVESIVESFKTQHKLTDVESEAKLFLETGTVSEANLLEISTQKALADYMYNYVVNHSKPEDLIPANLGLMDVALENTIEEYNKMVLNRNRLMRNSSENNPIVENLDQQLAGIKKSVLESLKNYKSALEIKFQAVQKRDSEISSKIATVPKYEREFRVIQRQQQIKETLYLYLLQKREETNIALAVTVANTKVIDHAESKEEPVFPKKKVLYFSAILLGLVLPAIILYIIGILDNKVHGKRDIDRIGVPFLGDIPNTASKEKVVVSKSANSSVAEAFRLLRTNLDFLLSTNERKGRVVFLTSTLGKEGKSFVAINLATSIALSGKRVLLIGMDVRAPKILQYLDLEDRPGLTNYISDRTASLESFIIPVPAVESLFLLPSGHIPPNPAELLLSDRVQSMFEIARKEYDYVIVDTAPIGMVTDTLLLSKYADACIYVVRAYYLDKRLLSVPKDLYEEKRMAKMAILINGTDKEKGYGYGYGYGYGGYGYGHDKPRPIWKRMFGIS